ncbi:MAG: hypothetical protein D6696_04560 [Acidobacteria bacterium]|nr:MAG: hypothetical protein D6696_04560 [Acidobacteriota bacterium]
MLKTLAPAWHLVLAVAVVVLAWSLAARSAADGGQPEEPAASPSGAGGRAPVRELGDGVASPAGGVRLPAGLLQLPPSVDAALVVDLSRNRMYVYKNHRPIPRLAADLYVSIGKNGSHKEREGDEKTPVGVYFVTDFIPGSRLPELYGAGAFPVDYPNLWDRRLGRTGSGIWIHGMPESMITRPPRSSRGCLTLANDDFRAIARSVEPGRTPVVISDRIEWLSPEAIAVQRNGVLRAQEAWRQAWESLDTERYLSFYATDFRSGNMDIIAWIRHKRRVNAAKSYIRVEVSDLGLYRYPGEDDLVLLDFLQTYRSSNYDTTSRKRQLWRLRQGRWRIVQEGRG